GEVRAPAPPPHPLHRSGPHAQGPWRHPVPGGDGRRPPASPPTPAPRPPAAPSRRWPQARSVGAPPPAGRRVSTAALPTSSLVLCHAAPLGRTAPSSVALLTSMPTSCAKPLARPHVFVHVLRFLPVHALAPAGLVPWRPRDPGRPGRACSGLRRPGTCSASPAWRRDDPRCSTVSPRQRTLVTSTYRATHSEARPAPRYKISAQPVHMSCPAA